MKLFLLGVALTCVLYGLVWACWAVASWQARMRQTFGDRFLAMAEEHEAIAHSWELRLVGDGHSGWAGWDCGRQADGIYRAMALTLIKGHRDLAREIRANIPGQPGYGPAKFDCANAGLRQREWQEWYDDFHRRYPPTAAEAPEE